MCLGAKHAINVLIGYRGPKCTIAESALLGPCLQHLCFVCVHSAHTSPYITATGSICTLLYTTVLYLACSRTAAWRAGTLRLACTATLHCALCVCALCTVCVCVCSALQHTAAWRAGTVPFLLSRTCARGYVPCAVIIDVAISGHASHHCVDTALLPALFAKAVLMFLCLFVRS